MKKISAVVMTAALVLPAVATSAAAEDEKITVDGLVWLDRDQNTKHDPSEPVLGNWRGVQVKKVGTDEVVGEFPTDANGRYRAELPAGRYIMTVLANGEYSTTNGMTRLVGSTATFDFGLRGASIAGRSFADMNRDGLRQADEELLSPGTLNGKPVPMPREDGQFSVEDLPYGKYKFVPADYTSHRLVLAAPNGTFEFTLGELEGPSPLDVRYIKPKGDLTISTPALSPAKDVYVVGDEVEATFQITNKGEAPESPTFTTGKWSLTTLAHSDNVEPTPGSYDEFAVKSPLLPGQSIDVKIRVRFDSTEPEQVNVLVRPSRWGDDPFKDNVRIVPIKVAERSAEISTPPASSTTTAPPATTTTPAVAKAGDKSGLASTGASPLGFLALGALLLAAGLGAFFVARRRRS
ncbi:LPXTG cell wall anchor domain-containing protein [Lentzea sp. NPDC004782]|uniref:LPXTG cell wall anchor domain-containing protein n=1 Tax=Lentzea sp. NPDC004782 TaxID=3154458 RepID=UPI0033BB039C